MNHHPLKFSLTMLDEFKKFILKGNVVGLSTGVIIGAAFTNIVTAFTKGFVEPILAIFGSGSTTPDFKIKIWEKMMKVTETVNGAEVKTEKLTPIFLDIGGLIGAILGFLITAAVVFFVIIKPMNKLMELVTPKPGAPPEAPPEALPPDVVLLTEIRDLLSGQRVEREEK
jgi:large conductance mechanosensitive channel